MPFTLSHAAAVLPFRRTRLPWSALIIGSFGPDFEYFLRMNYESRAWHFYPDVLLYCLPFTLLTYFAFHLFVRRPALELLPQSIQSRLKPAATFPPLSLEGVLMLIGSIALGITTHLVWDSLTHASSWPWAHVSLLRERFDVPFVGHAYGFGIAQAVSSFLGIVFLTIALWGWYRETSPQLPLSRTLCVRKTVLIWLGMTALAVVGAFWRSFHVFGIQQTLRFGSLSRLLLVIATIGCFLWELLAYGVFITLWRKSKEAHR